MFFQLFMENRFSHLTCLVTKIEDYQPFKTNIYFQKTIQGENINDILLRSKSVFILSFFIIFFPFSCHSPVVFSLLSQ